MSEWSTLEAEARLALNVVVGRRSLVPYPRIPQQSYPSLAYISHPIQAIVYKTNYYYIKWSQILFRKSLQNKTFTRIHFKKEK